MVGQVGRKGHGDLGLAFAPSLDDRQKIKREQVRSINRLPGEPSETRPSTVHKRSRPAVVLPSRCLVSATPPNGRIATGLHEASWAPRRVCCKRGMQRRKSSGRNRREIM